MANNKSKPKKTKQPMGKGKKIAIITVSAALLVGGGITAYMYSGQIGEFIDRWFHGAKIAKVDNEYQIEKGVVESDHPETVLPYRYLGSAEKRIEGEEDPAKAISTHTFLIGRVNSVPFYQSGWTKFDYENIGMTISFSQISSESISTSLSTTNERSESTSWSTSTHFQEKFVAKAEAKIGPVKASAENTIDYQVDKSSSGSNLQRYVSSNEQTNASVETLQKAADYTIQLNSRNGFKKGKYYRMTLQQTASMYMVIYENATEGGDRSYEKNDQGEELEKDNKYYELTSFLADPSNYTMVVEETDNPSVEPEVPEGERFDATLYEKCASWIERVREGKTEEGEISDFTWVTTEEEPEPPSRHKQLSEIFGSVSSIKSDYYHRDTEWRITDAGKSKNPSDKVTFPTLFKSRLAPTFAELFNKSTDVGHEGFDFKYVDIEIQFEFRRYDHANQHVYLVDKNGSEIKHVGTDIDDYTKWTKKNITWTGIDAIDKLRTTMDPAKADGWIHVMYDGSGNSDDDWGIRNFMMQVTISK